MKSLILKAWCALEADRRGVTALEYALVAGLIVTAMATAFTIFFGDLQTALGDIGAAIPT